MKLLRTLVLFSAVLAFWQCATPGTPPANPPRPTPNLADDDHRSVPQEEFQKGPWVPLGPAVSWAPEPSGAAFTLADGRVVRLGFVAPAVVRWWVPAGPGDRPQTPSARYPKASGVTVKVTEVQGTVEIESPGLGLRVRMADLSWVLVKGDATLLKTAGGPRIHGRRLLQAFDSTFAARWAGLGLTPDRKAAKFWVDPGSNPEGTGPWAVPALFGAGGPGPLALYLDNSYQTYTRVTPAEVSLGALNGGLDLLAAAAPGYAETVSALTALTGRPDLPPAWAHSTALVLPAGEPGTFLRDAKLSVQTAAGPFRADRLRFQNLLSVPVTAPGSGIDLPVLPGRYDWDAAFPDAAGTVPLARMANQLPAQAAQAARDAWQTANPGSRPYLLTGSGGQGSVRQALPELRVTAGNDDQALTDALNLGTLGQGTPAIRLDLTPLGQDGTKEAAFHSLLAWLFAPGLTLDWGPDPARFWAALAPADQKRLKAILDQRSRFRPLFDQAARQAALTGVPAWKPLWFEAPGETQALACDDEYLWGDGLLAAPVTGSGTTRSVYLPGPGVWFDFWTGQEYGGGRKYDLDLSSDHPLLFARGGAVLPVREPETFDDKAVYNPLTVHVFPGGRGSGTYYLDDGLTLGWKTGGYWETRLTYDFNQSDMSLDHDTVHNPGGKSPDPYILYRLHDVFKPKAVKINGKPIPLFGESWGITDTDRSAAWYESDHTLLVKTFHAEDSQTIQMSF